MEYSYALHQEAFEEYTDALSWYQDRGKSTQFRSVIKHAIAAIRENPYAWQMEEKDERFRRYIIRQFPYKVVYSVDTNKKHVYIIAIASTYRKPGYWQERAD